MKKLFRYMKGYRKECVLGPLLKLLEATLELFVPYVILRMVNIGIADADGSYIVWCVLLLVGMGLIGLAFSLAAQYFSAKAAVGLSSRVREALFAHIQSLSYREIDTLGRSTLITRLTSDMNQVQTAVNLALRLLLRSPFVVFGAAIMAFTIDADAALVFVVVIPVLAVAVFAIMLAGIPLYKGVQKRLDIILGKTRENLAGVRMLRAMGREEEETESFTAKNEELLRSQKFVGRISALMNPLTFIIINIAVAFLIYRGGVKVHYGILTQGAVLALYNYMSQILIELIKLANLIITITKGVACGNRIASVFEVTTSLDVAETTTATPSDVAVSFANVSFRFAKGGDYALKDVSFSIRAGQTVGIIGGTGSGKSTLIHLICRFYDATEGSVTLYGTPVKELAPESVLNRVGIVPQKATLFSGTVRTNLLFGKEDATDKEMWEALEIAQTKDFISKLPEGLNAPIEQNGRNLSGGQRQRLTVARAVLRKPQILILDDSSSALDYRTDLAMRRAIAEISSDMTVILVSQRVSALRGADKILVLDEGSLVGIGTHDELYASCDVYQEICDSQSKSE